MHTINTKTRLCAVIGNPVEHSLSPAIHNAAFEAESLNYVYLAFQVDALKEFLAGMRAMPSFRGLSVTIPHKMSIMPYLDTIEPMAEHIASVNTVLNEEGHLTGLSTDGPGTLRAFEQADVSLKGKRVLFVGSGGAVRAVAFAIAELAEPECVTILGRTPSRVHLLAEDLRAKTSAVIHEASLQTDIESAVREHEVIIQGTPVGMYPHGEGQTCIPAHCLQKGHIAFDMVYRPHLTRFLSDARDAGCKLVYGIDMLVNQAALQFEYWTGRPAPVAVMKKAVSSYLQ